MSREGIREIVLRSLESVAPEVDAASVDPRVDLREELDIDSMDFLSFVTVIHDELGVEIPEADYPRIGTIDGCVEYLAAKLPEADHGRA